MNNPASLSEEPNFLSKSCTTGVTERSFIDHAKSPHNSHENRMISPAVVYVSVPTVQSFGVASMGGGVVASGPGGTARTGPGGPVCTGGVVLMDCGCNRKRVPWQSSYVAAGAGWAVRYTIRAINETAATRGGVSVAHDISIRSNHR